MKKIKFKNLKKILSITMALFVGGNVVGCTNQEDKKEMEISESSYSIIETERTDKVKLSDEVLKDISETMYGLQYYADDYENLVSNNNQYLNILTAKQRVSLFKCVKSYAIYMDAQKSNDEFKMNQAINDMIEAIDNFGDLSKTLAKTLSNNLDVHDYDEYLFGPNLYAQPVIENEDYNEYVHLLYLNNSSVYTRDPKYISYREDEIDAKIKEFNHFLKLFTKYQIDPIFKLDDIDGNLYICNREMFANVATDQERLDYLRFEGVFRKCVLSKDESNKWVLEADDYVLRVLENEDLIKSLNYISAENGSHTYNYKSLENSLLTYEVFNDGGHTEKFEQNKQMKKRLKYPF